MSRMIAVLSALLFLAAGLSGCLGEDGFSPTGRDGGESGAKTTEEGRHSMAPAHRFSDDGDTSVVFSAAGGFSLHEYCFPASCLVAGLTGQEAHRHYLDLTEYVPIGIPARIFLEFVYEQEFMGGVSLWIESGEATVFHSEETRDFGEVMVESLLMRPDEATQVVVVIHAGTTGPPPETTWNLEAEITADAARVPGGVPVRVPVERGATGFVASTEGGESEFMLWGPDDTFLGVFRTEDGVYNHSAAGNARGDYILMIMDGFPSLRLNATGSDPRPGTLTVMPVVWTPAGDPQPVAPSGRTEWSFEVEETPIAVGLALRVDGIYMNTFTDARVDSPSGTVLDASIVCGLCLDFTGGPEVLEQWSSRPGHSDHEPGTYQVTVDVDLAADFNIQAYVITYQR